MSAARPWRSLGVTRALLLAACVPAPTATPTPPSQPTTPGPTTTPSAPISSAIPSSGAVPALATALRAAVDQGAIVADLERLETITLQNGGTRAAGSDGYDVAATFVADELRALGYSVTTPEILAPLFAETGPGTLEIDAPRAPIFDGGEDFRAMLLSPSGDVTARVFALGFDPAARPESTNGLGCDAKDWTGVPPAMIVLVQPGRCLMRTVVEHAQAAGAVALVRSTPGWEPGEVLRPTLLDPAGLTIPAVGATHQVGLALDEAADEGQEVHLAISTSVVMRPMVSVIGETAAGDPGRVVMLGGHLDSVVDGPGINDNGSGTMAVLEIARRLAAISSAGGPSPAWRVRVAFWSAEELGVWGSSRYVAGLPDAERSRIAAYLNLDMLGSINGVRDVYHLPESAGSAAIEGLLVAALEDEGLAWSTIGGGSSDDLPFVQAGIPIGGLFSGHNSAKTAAQVTAFGGTLGESLDPCYHLACDTLDNVDPVRLAELARAAAWVTGYLTSGEVVLQPPN
ncbi:MAG: M28 family peptidase [Chloroflexi bacterium]|nr:M28 family peptidase [Chloroflexota bacterium]